jgi:uncharacterized membrane protein
VGCIVSNFRRFVGKYCFQLQAFWWNVLLPTLGVLVGRIASNLGRFGGTYCSQFQAFCWKVLLPILGVLVERIASNFSRFGGTYCFQLQASWWNVLLPTSTFFPGDEGRTFLLNIGILLSDYTAQYVIRHDIYSQRHKTLKHVAGVQACNSEVCFTSKSIFSIETQYGTSIVLRDL